MKLLCVNTSVVYDLMEHSDYYSTLYYNRRVCQDDKYLLNIEETEYNIVATGIEKTRKGQQSKVIHEQLEQEPICTNNIKATHIMDNVKIAMTGYVIFDKDHSSSAIDELIDNATNERINNYFEYIKHDTEYLEKLEAKSIYLINELAK
uniref:Uncharacterized protein n=1 Tax=Meloidogyne javanica TaxID=6303 RepID=A0A915ND40_MELJA